MVQGLWEAGAAPWKGSGVPFVLSRVPPPLPALPPPPPRPPALSPPCFSPGTPPGPRGLFFSRAGTLRGLHYQVGPSAEIKIVTCLQGALHDVVLDLRSNSPTFGRHAAIELSAANRRLLVIPEGCAHGFLTAQDATLLLYMVSRGYDPARERAVRWDDPAFALYWPSAPRVISPRDAAIPDFDPGHHLAA